MLILPNGKLAFVGGGWAACDIRRPRNPQPRDLTGMFTRISIPEKIRYVFHFCNVFGYCIWKSYVYFTSFYIVYFTNSFKVQTHN